jgi:hypothetical protein
MCDSSQPVMFVPLPSVTGKLNRKLVKIWKGENASTLVFDMAAPREGWASWRTMVFELRPFAATCQRRTYQMAEETFEVGLRYCKAVASCLRHPWARAMVFMGLNYEDVDCVKF